MVRYKIMFREKEKKKFYNFGPTVHTTSKPRYSKIDSIKKARSVKRELERTPSYRGRVWRIKRK